MGDQSPRNAHPGWTIAGTLVAAAGLLVAILSSSSDDDESPTAQPTVAPSVTPDVAPPPSEESSPVATPSTESSAAPVVAPPETLYLADMDEEAFVQEPHWVWSESGAASIGGVEYPNSLMYEFQNCSSCREDLELIVPPGYGRLTGVFGLSDASRHDDVIDGVVYLAIYDASGNQILPSQRIEYPGSVPVDLEISGTPRIRIEMSEGTNYEQFVLGTAALHTNQ